ncbi:MAG TPA: Uma2 family endonuclease [Kofleriaceae bacterium]
MVLSKPIHLECELPPVDERLVVPETRHEIHDGELVHVPPADAPHATRHSKTSALVEAHVRSEFDVATDLLTRTSRTNDFAPDVSVFPFAPDPRTGGRQLEQLAFEVVSTESLSHAGDKAAKLVARGVRRVFAIDIERLRLLEWSGPLARWREIEAGSCIEDPVLAVPIPIEPLIRAVKADDAMSRALLIKENPVLMEALDRREQKGLEKGRQEGMAKGLLAVLAARGISLEPADKARIFGESDPQRFERWFARAVYCATVADIFVEP